MRRPLAAMLLAALVAVATALPAAAQEPGTATTSPEEVRIGDHFVVDVTVPLNGNESAEIDRAASSWGAVEVIDVIPDATDDDTATFTVTVAAFATGPVSFRPAVFLDREGAVEQRILPEVTVDVASSLPEGAPLEVTDVAPPRPAAGEQSPLLIPAIVAGAALAAVAVLAIIVFVARRLLRPGASERQEPISPDMPDGLDAAEQLLATDYVAAYRMLSSVFRTRLGTQFELPAPALTSSEIEGRMTEAGIDPWLARLSREVLAACDAVVYAGYSPAAERQHADFAMAREVVAPEPEAA